MRAGGRSRGECGGAGGCRGRGCSGDGYDLYASASACTGGHEKSILIIGSWDRDPLRLIGAAACCRLLGTGRVVMEGFGKIGLEPLHVFESQGEQEGADIGIRKYSEWHRDWDRGFTTWLCSHQCSGPNITRCLKVKWAWIDRGNDVYEVCTVLL